jgi:hypothetical protein
MSSRAFRCAFPIAAILVLLGCDNTSFRTIPGKGPVKEFKVTLDGREMSEVFVWVNSGVKLKSLIDISVFDGLNRNMTSADAQQRLGAPRELRMHPTMKVLEHLYTTPKGELDFLEVPTSLGTEHQVWAYPKNRDPAAIILDESLRSQLISLLPKERMIRVHILRDVGFGGMTIVMSGMKVDSLILGMRDGE